MANRVVNGCEKRGVDVITDKIDGNYSILANFGRTHPLYRRVLFFYEAYISMG